MANNRMYLLCVPCTLAEGVSIQDARFYLAKYYPNTGWYCSRDPVEKLGYELNAWLDKHKHGSMFGEDITLVYGSIFGGIETETRNILEAIVEHVADVQSGVSPSEKAKNR